MATFKFGPTNSVFTNGATAFGGGVAGANSLMVDPGGFLITTSSLSSAVLLNPLGPWTVTINGSVLAGGHGIELAGLPSDFSPTAPPKSTITIGKEGSVQSGAGGSPIVLSRPATLNNAGFIIEAATNNGAIVLNGQSAHTIINSGYIDGDISRSGTGATTLTNSGTIDGDVALGSANDIVNNSGFIFFGVNLGEGSNKLTLSKASSISGGIFFGAGNDTFTNAGSTSDVIFMGSGNDTVTNTGLMSFGINLGSGANKLTNSGTIKTSFIDMGDDADTIVNSGVIEVDIQLRGGSNVLTNSKMISASVFGGANSDKVTNSGTITGDVVLGDGDDIYSATGIGFVSGSVVDGGGSDTYKFGTGGGTLNAVGTNSNAGIDQVTGGTSINDTYSVKGATSPGMIVINLDSTSHGASDFGMTSEFAKNTASGADIGTDVLKGMDNVEGSNQSETVFGTATRNVINGSGGQDFLAGLGGADFLQGGSGADVIVGGAGADGLFGSDSAAGDGVPDVFQYFSTSESGATAATRDTIYDFEDGIDLIFLTRIDANTALANDQDFHFIGMNVNWDNSGAGQLRSYWTAIGHIVEGDVNGDKKADFSIAIVDTDHSIAFSGADFIL